MGHAGYSKCIVWLHDIAIMVAQDFVDKDLKSLLHYLQIKVVLLSHIYYNERFVYLS